MITAVLLALLCSAPDAAGTPLSPDALGAPPHADESPTAWACTVETLRAGRECVFEAEVSSSTDVKAQSASNIRSLKEIGHTLCLEAAKPPSGVAADKNLVAQCERKYSEAADDACGLDGKVPIIDAKGRFAPAARACYRQLSSVLQDTAMMAAVASACCQCAEKRGCPAAGERCHENVSHQELSATALACLASQCGASCELMIPANQTTSGDSRPARRVRQSSAHATGSL
ncbi:hypothetical protein [Vitiosangium sp. GDMCC 1.1324]|uniref:hypothetical protein n=1 Tax=Vitiosangium sp. (strain GDMCC 1.1324) TaxID=2138576 RepID=UPI0018EE533A|nr:hypothetical protein [Vitiosangium sp. GDMCC 1.1324]